MRLPLCCIQLILPGFVCNLITKLYHLCFQNCSIQPQILFPNIQKAINDARMKGAALPLLYFFIIDAVEHVLFLNLASSIDVFCSMLDLVSYKLVYVETCNKQNSQCSKTRVFEMWCFKEIISFKTVPAY